MKEIDARSKSIDEEKKYVKMLEEDKKKYVKMFEESEQQRALQKANPPKKQPAVQENEDTDPDE
jgi:hypothetical protein